MPLAEPVGRGTAAAVALAGACDRPAAATTRRSCSRRDHLVGDEPGSPGHPASGRRRSPDVPHADGGPGRLVDAGHRAGRARDGPRVHRGRGGRSPAARVRSSSRASWRSPPRRRPGRCSPARLRWPWNAGIFLWRRDALDAAFVGRLAGHPRRRRGRAWPAELAGSKAAYARVRLDVASTGARAQSRPPAAGARGDAAARSVGWSDLGSWSASRDALAARAAVRRRGGSRASRKAVAGRGPRSDLGSGAHARPRRGSARRHHRAARHHRRGCRGRRSSSRPQTPPRRSRSRRRHGGDPPGSLAPPGHGAGDRGATVAPARTPASPPDPGSARSAILTLLRTRRRGTARWYRLATTDGQGPTWPRSSRAGSGARSARGSAPRRTRFAALTPDRRPGERRAVPPLRRGRQRQGPRRPDGHQGPARGRRRRPRAVGAR